MAEQTESRIWLAFAGSYDDEYVVGAFTTELAAARSLIGARLVDEGWRIDSEPLRTAPITHAQADLLEHLGGLCEDVSVPLADPEELTALRARLTGTADDIEPLN